MRWRHLFTRYGIDILVLLIAIGAEVEVGRGTIPGDRTVASLFALAWTLPLLARRRLAFLAPLAVVAAVIVDSFVEPGSVDAGTSALFAVLVAAWVFAVENDRPLAFAGAAATFAAIVVVAEQEPDGFRTGNVAFPAVFAGLAFIAGLAMRGWLQHAGALAERASVLERTRAEEARHAVAEERARIARELHDVVAHSVSVMVVQAGAARRLLLPGQEREREALQTIERTGREALTEMRRMLGVMRSADEGAALAPQPSLEHLDTLIAQVREAGLPVRLRVEGEAAPLPPGVDLSAYRIVQEGLTNALKHAGRARAEVVVRYADRAVELEIEDDGAGVTATDGQGHGLVGMRERVAVYGGELESGPRPEGGYRLRVRLPVEAS